MKNPLDPDELQKGMDDLKEYYWEHGCFPPVSSKVQSLADEMCDEIIEAFMKPPRPIVELIH